MVCVGLSSCVVCSVWRLGPTVRLYRRLLEELPALALQASEWRMNEKRYSYMRDLVLCVVVSHVVLRSLSLSFSLSLSPSSSLSLSVSWCASLFYGIMLSALAIGDAIARRLRLWSRDCGPRGSIASTIVGALCCECLWWLGGGWRYALLDRTSLLFVQLCRDLVGADLVANAIIAVLVTPRTN